MSGFVNPLARPRHGVPAQAATIKTWTRNALGLSDDVVVSVNQLSCAEPGCPPQETVILVLPGGNRALKLAIHKALTDVTEIDVVNLAGDFEEMPPAV
ncbi:hypothetical protein [Sinorhizobium sp. NFACC03]|uniref:hypothetical protein n=1 Tax=Sinorhizobium sp. NFACC03 TaxID=1566295 RepID=UPI000891FE47|nr:hypothetical protein [Sinorhizobium sp. NFACC03]SDA87420.1 hypothetical protein SAMN03159448_03953 [Sinorhizobium sp. NFACC03]